MQVPNHLPPNSPQPQKAIRAETPINTVDEGILDITEEAKNLQLGDSTLYEFLVDEVLYNHLDAFWGDYDRDTPADVDSNSIKIELVIAEDRSKVSFCINYHDRTHPRLDNELSEYWYNFNGKEEGKLPYVRRKALTKENAIAINTYLETKGIVIRS